MRKSRYIGLLAVLALMLLLGMVGSSPVTAQSYRFSVPEVQMQVYLQSDGSARIIYDITFQNASGAHAIDIVDIGLPHRGYNISTMRASLDGNALPTIRRSEEIAIGVEIPLGAHSIRAGQEGTLHFECVMPDMVYQDTTNKENASFQITPTWFDSSLVQGTTDLWIVVYMLPGIQPDEVLYQDRPFDNKVIYGAADGDRVAVGWHFPAAKFTQAHRVGVSFPQRGMTNVIRMNAFQLAAKWVDDNPAVRFTLLAGLFIGFTWLFFRFSGGTGFTVYVLLACGLIWLGSVSAGVLLAAVPILPALILFNEFSLRGRRKTYLPPIAQVEGGGIKRGLTAPEAAVLLELPLNKILTLVVFGLLEKGVLRQLKEEPLTVEVVEAFAVVNHKLTKPRERQKFRQEAAQDRGTVIHKYENAFLDIIEAGADKPLGKLDFGLAMRGLIDQTVAKMKKFDLSDTQDYYRKIITRAMQQAQGINIVEQREEFLDKYSPWVMMDNAYPTVFNMGGYHYWPRWARQTSGGGGAQARSAPTSPAAPGGRTSFGDVSRSFAGWAEGTAGGLAGAILPKSLGGGPSGLLNLSGVDRVTGDIFKAMSESSGSSGGGGGGGSSCACAGCACACACAGGGR